MLKAAAIAGGAATLLPGGSITARASTPGQEANQTDRTFQAFVRLPAGASVEELRLLPVTGRRVVVRTEACQLCYTIVNQALGAGPNPPQANILGHGGVGIVEAVGPEARRVRMGDRVLVSLTQHCGECYNCMRGQADRCLGYGDPPTPIAEMSDRTPVFGDIGGCAELMVPNDERLVPIFTDLPADELSLLTCVSACGLGTTMFHAPLEAGTDVAVLGAGPVGLSAIQGARIKGASQIIAVEPIGVRRELALKVGATIALDPNEEGDDLVERIQDLCRAKTDRRVAGGGWVGPDLVVEAVGGDRFPPTVEAGPDPTGVLSLQQAWDLCSRTGYVVTCGVGRPADAVVTFPANRWANGAKHHHPGNFSGTNAKRDMPQFVRFMETGQFDGTSLVTWTGSLDRIREGFQAAADRTTVNAVLVFT